MCLLTRHHPSALTERRICLSLPPTGLHRDFQHPAGLPFCVTPSLKRLSKRRRNINLLPIGYASRPRLRGRLTQGRLTLPWKPWAYGEGVSHPLYRYSCQHLHFSDVHHPSQVWLLPSENAPLPCQLLLTSVASVPCLAPLHFRRRPARPVSCYAFFKGWLLLSQPPGCLCQSTSFPTQHGFRDLSQRSGLFPSRPRTFSPVV